MKNKNRKHMITALIVAIILDFIVTKQLHTDDIYNMFGETMSEYHWAWLDTFLNHIDVLIWIMCFFVGRYYYEAERKTKNSGFYHASPLLIIPCVSISAILIATIMSIVVHEIYSILIPLDVLYRVLVAVLVGVLIGLTIIPIVTQTITGLLGKIKST